MKIIKIKLIDSVNDKFHVTLTLIDTKDTNFHSIDGFLPYLPSQLETSFQKWKEAYSDLEDVRKVATRLSPKSVINHSSAEQKEQVKITLNQWLDSGERSWQPIRDELISVLSSLQSSEEEIRLFLDIQNPNLRRIPWQEWSLFESRFPQTEIAIRVRGRGKFKTIRKLSKVRIIAIVGKSDGINTELDLIENPLNCSGSLNGKFLQVTIADDEYLPETAEKIAQALVENDKILAVIGHSSSDMTLQAGEIYNKAELVVISPTSTSTRLRNFGKFVFRVAPSDDLAAQGLFNYLNQQNWADKKIAVAYIPGNNYSESLAKELNKLLPEEFVYKCNISVGTFSASDCVEEAKNKGAEIMFLVPATDRTLGNIIGIINNAKGLKLLGGDSAYNPRVLKDAGKQAEQANLTLAIPWHRYPNSEFAQTAKKFWNAEVSWRTATSYDATKTIIKAVDEMTGNYSRKQLQSILSSRDFFVEGVTGKIQFGGLGDRQFVGKDKSVLVEVKPNEKSGKYEFVILDK